MNLARPMQRQHIEPRLGLAYKPCITLEFGDQQRQPRDLDGEILDLYAVEIFQLHPRFRIVAKLRRDLMLYFAHADIGDDEEIAGTAGRVEDAYRGDAAAQGAQLADAVVRRRQLLAQSSRNSGFRTLRMFGTLV